jgi:hypothetical protein
MDHRANEAQLLDASFEFGCSGLGDGSRQRSKCCETRWVGRDHFRQTIVGALRD